MNQEKIEELRKHFSAIKELSKDLTEKDVADCYGSGKESPSFCDFLANLLNYKGRPGPWTYKDFEILQALRGGLIRAEELHPGFAEGQYQALGFLGEEYGEVVKVVTKGEGEQRLHDELRDLLVVTWRFLRGDHEVGCLCDDCKYPCESCGRDKHDSQD